MVAILNIPLGRKDDVMADHVLRDWHHLFGLLLTDFFTDSPFTVDVERDLSQQQQFLDVVILRRKRGQKMPVRLPDGLPAGLRLNGLMLRQRRTTECRAPPP